MIQISLLNFPAHVLWASYCLVRKEYVADTTPGKPVIQCFSKQRTLIAFLEGVVEAAAEGDETNAAILEEWEILLMSSYEAYKLYRSQG